MTQQPWQQRIELALTAPVDSLIVDDIKVVGGLEGDLQCIDPDDIRALQEWGLPATGAIKLQPAIKPTITSYYLIGSSYDLGSLDGRRLFVRPQTGRVIDVTEEDGVRYQFVNSSIKQFAELAWRYHHIKPVRVWLAEQWEVLGAEVEFDAAQMVWRKAIEIDHRIDTDESVSFWPAMIFDLL